MVSRGRMSDDVSYVLLETPLIPRLDLTDCRPTELPVLPETTPTQPLDHAPLGSGGKGAGHSKHLHQLLTTGTGSDRDRVPLLPRGTVPGIKPPVTEVRTLVVDMRDLDKMGTASSNRTNDDDDYSGDEIIIADPAPSRAGRRSGGVLKGGGDYVSSGEPKPRPRVSFLLDATPTQSQEGGTVQIRVYAKPPKIPLSDGESADQSDTGMPGGQQGLYHYDQALPNGLPPRKLRPHGSADSRHSSAAYRQQIRQLQAGAQHAEARLREAYTSAVRSAEHSYRTRRLPYEDPSVYAASHASGSTQFPAVSAHNRRVPLFSFRRNSAADMTTPGHASQTQATPPSQSTHVPREGRQRKNFMLPPSSGGVARQVRFQETDLGVTVGERNEGGEYAKLHSRHVEPRLHTNHAHSPHAPSQRVLGTYSVAEHPPRAAASCKPPLPRSSLPPSSASLESGSGGGAMGQSRVTSANTRSGRVREWLSVDTVPSSAAIKNRPRPSTVSSASSSTRSRDINSAKQRLAGSSRVSSASVKAASDPGPDLDNMDLVTLNLMARRAKGPSRYRYLAKLRSLNLNTPRPPS